MRVFKSKVNSFHYLYQDAEYFHQIAQKPDVGFDGVRASRTALLLYILSLEALINRALDHFLPERLHDFFLEREDRFSLEEKWLLLPLLASGHDDQNSTVRVILGLTLLNSLKYGMTLHIRNMIGLRSMRR